MTKQLKPVRRSGYTQETPFNYLINAGAVFLGLKWDKEQNKWVYEKRLGATSDGNKFMVEQNYRTIEVDGVFTAAKGQKVLESQNAKIEVNVKEITAENIKLALNGSITSGNGETAPSEYKVIETKSKLELTDYIDNIGIVGTLSGTEKPVVIIIYNALCTSGLEFEMKDNDEAVVTMTFEAHADEGNVEDLKAPFAIYWPTIDGLSEV